MSRKFITIPLKFYFLAIFCTFSLSTPAIADIPPSKTLYERLGGTTAIKAVVDQFVANCAGDQRISHFFKDTAADKERLETFKNHLVNQICSVTSGPCTYGGKDMKTAHSGMKITDADFDALVEDLIKALQHFKVAKQEQDDLLAILGPLRAIVVEVKKAA